MKLVIDTNVLVSALSSRSVFHWIIQDLIAEKFEIATSHEVLLEYEEILKKKYDVQTAENFLRALQELPNVQLSEIYFQWKLLADPDDNKFVDLAISANADYLLSEDNDFNLLQSIDFPKVTVLKIDNFRKILYP
ncbi:MAG: putative toxin-antitoxin system toxin component, PIN family [Saprospiraceae bacterium]